MNRSYSSLGQAEGDRSTALGCSGGVSVGANNPKSTIKEFADADVFTMIFPA
jgi:hypothetical protein